MLVFGCGADVIYPQAVRAARPPRARCRRSRRGDRAVGHRPQALCLPQAQPHHRRARGAVCTRKPPSRRARFPPPRRPFRWGARCLPRPERSSRRRSRGTNRLIADGACALIDEESLEVAISRIFGVLRFCRTAPAADNVLCERDAQVMAALTASPLRAEEVASMLGISQLDALTLLSELSGTGRVERLLDGRFAPTKLARAKPRPSCTIDNMRCPRDAAQQRYLRGPARCFVDGAVSMRKVRGASTWRP